MLSRPAWWSLVTTPTTASVKKISTIFFMLMLCFGLGLSAADSTWMAIEVIAPVGKSINAKKITQLSKDAGSSAVYQWNNHLVMYGQLKRLGFFHHELETAYPGCEIKEYQNPFYVFDRSHCGGKGTVKEWDNIVLAANLVADPKMQQEYLNYHKTQFEKWPEVSNGFCNAQFQQLLVFKNGRQLMLIISIPKGKSLDDLNPLTSKNNPRVDEWNKLMSKYQEGIPGTKKGETWVFLKEMK